MSRYRCARYIYPVINRKTRSILLREAANRLKGIEFDAIAFSGMSGALFAPMLANRLKKDIIMVRKGQDDTHSCLKVEGCFGDNTKYIIVDDLLDTGTTVDRIISSIREKNPNAKAVGLYLYNSYASADNDNEWCGIKYLNRCNYDVIEAHRKLYKQYENEWLGA